MSGGLPRTARRILQPLEVTKIKMGVNVVRGCYFLSESYTELSELSLVMLLSRLPRLRRLGTEIKNPSGWICI